MGDLIHVNFRKKRRMNKQTTDLLEQYEQEYEKEINNEKRIKWFVRILALIAIISAMVAIWGN